MKCSIKKEDLRKNSLKTNRRATDDLSVPLPLTFAIFALISTYFLSDPKLFRPIAFSVDFNNSDCAAFEIRLQNVCSMCRGVHPSLNHFFRTVIVLCKILAIKNFVIRCIPSASVRSGMGKTSYDFIGSYFGCILNLSIPVEWISTVSYSDFIHFSECRFCIAFCSKCCHGKKCGK